jgi:HrpA-like RNA helicase
MGSEELTDLGREVAKLPLNWQEAVCLLKAKFLRVEGALCKILAMISVAPSIEDLFTNIPENSPKYGEYKKKMYNWENAAGEIFAMKIMFEKFLEAGDRGIDWCNANFLQGSKFINAKKLFYKLLGNAKELKNISFWRGKENEQSEPEKKKITLALEEGFALNIATRKNGNVYTVQRPCGEVKIEKSPFIKKIGKRVLFLDIKIIQGEPKISSIVNLSSKKLNA